MASLLRQGYRPGHAPALSILHAFITFFFSLFRTHSKLALENIFQRQQLIVLRRHV